MSFSEDDPVYYMDRHDYLCKMFIHQHTKYLPFSYWDEKSTQLANRCYEEEFDVKISAANMRKYLDETHDILRHFMEYELSDKYGFFFYCADNYHPRQLVGFYVQYMEDFRLEHRFVGCGIGDRSEAWDLAYIKAFGRGKDGKDDPFMDADIACTQIAYVTQMLCHKAIYAAKENADIDCPNIIRPPSDWITWKVDVKKLPKRYMEMIGHLDCLADAVIKDMDYNAGRFLLDLLDIEKALDEINTKESILVLDYLLGERETLMQDKQFLAALVVDPRINNSEDKFLTKEQKEIGLNHLMCHWKNYNRFKDRYHAKENVKEEDLVEELTDQVEKLGIHKPKKKGIIRKKIRALEKIDPLPHETDVFAYWSEKAKEDPELANLASLAFAETAPCVSVQWMARLLDNQNTTDEELEKLTYITYTTVNFYDE